MKPARMTATPTLSRHRERPSSPRWLRLIALPAAAATPRHGTVQDANRQAAAPAARFEARLNLVNNNGTVRYDGTVDSEASRKAIEAMLRQAYGAGSCPAACRGCRAKPAPWQAQLPQFLTAFTMPGAAIGFDGRRIELSGYASQADRAALLARAEQLFPGYTFAGLFRGVGGDRHGRRRPGAGQTQARRIGRRRRPGPEPDPDPVRSTAAPRSARTASPLLSQAAKAIQGSGGERADRDHRPGRRRRGPGAVAAARRGDQGAADRQWRQPGRDRDPRATAAAGAPTAGQVSGLL